RAVGGRPSPRGAERRERSKGSGSTSSAVLASPGGQGWLAGPLQLAQRRLERRRRGLLVPRLLAQLPPGRDRDVGSVETLGRALGHEGHHPRVLVVELDVVERLDVQRVVQAKAQYLQSPRLRYIELEQPIVLGVDRLQPDEAVVLVALVLEPDDARQAD